MILILSKKSFKIITIYLYYTILLLLLNYFHISNILLTQFSSYNHI